MEDTDLFERVRHWKDFRLQATHLFPTDASLRWFIRCNERELTTCGAVLKLRRGTYVDPAPFGAIAIDLMRHDPRAMGRS